MTQVEKNRPQPRRGGRAGAAEGDQDIAQQRPDHSTTSERKAPGVGEGEPLAYRPAPAPSPGSAEDAAEIDRGLGAGSVFQTYRAGANAEEGSISAGAAPEIASKPGAGFTSPSNRSSRREFDYRRRARGLRDDPLK
jgi:hypothetical protein